MIDFEIFEFGQRRNKAKSCIFFSHNAEKDVVREIITMAKCQSLQILVGILECHLFTIEWKLLHMDTSWTR